MHGTNIGDLLNASTSPGAGSRAGSTCTTVNAERQRPAARGCTMPTQPTSPAFTSTDYIPHHQPFQYYASTRNPTHARPSSIAAIGHSKIPDQHAEPANHQYDLDDFFAALNAGNLPAVSFLKAPAFQDGHAGYSDPLDEQPFIVKAINAVQKQPDLEGHRHRHRV